MPLSCAAPAPVSPASQLPTRDTRPTSSPSSGAAAKNSICALSPPRWSPTSSPNLNRPYGRTALRSIGSSFRLTPQCSVLAPVVLLVTTRASTLPLSLCPSRPPNRSLSLRSPLTFALTSPCVQTATPRNSPMHASVIVARSLPDPTTFTIAGPTNDLFSGIASTAPSCKAFVPFALNPFAAPVKHTTALPQPLCILPFLLPMHLPLTPPLVLTLCPLLLTQAPLFTACLTPPFSHACTLNAASLCVLLTAMFSKAML